jgi:hypothetical protein
MKVNKVAMWEDSMEVRVGKNLATKTNGQRSTTKKN